MNNLRLLLSILGVVLQTSLICYISCAGFPLWDSLVTELSDTIYCAAAEYDTTQYIANLVPGLKSETKASRSQVCKYSNPTTPYLLASLIDFIAAKRRVLFPIKSLVLTRYTGKRFLFQNFGQLAGISTACRGKATAERSEPVAAHQLKCCASTQRTHSFPLGCAPRPSDPLLTPLSWLPAQVTLC